MNCRKVQYYLSTYSEGSLSSDKLSEVEVHIRNCKSCEREKFILEEILVAARSLPAKTTPDDFNLKLFNRIYAEQNNPSESYLQAPESSWIRRPIGWVSAFATVAVVALITVVFLQRPAGSPDVPLNSPAYSQMESTSPASTSSGRHVSSRIPVSAYENIIGVSGSASNYRATNMSQIRTLRLADSQVESLYVEMMRRLCAEPRPGMVRANTRYYEMRSPFARTGSNSSPLLRNAASTISY
ncbi:MAG: zf-HC2 domain-containing protein [Candidatus Zixiibacteriota bacterium]|nr:MAG: zf-HC2 domain-containing protein [candidate division Zixibacteria bacterium]